MDLLAIKQALISMGYRKMGKKEDTEEDVYGKPIGFGLLTARITNEQTIVITTMFKSPDGFSRIWNKSEIKCSPTDENEMLYDGITLYNAYCYKICEAEIDVDTSKITESCHSHEPYAFKTDYDVYQIMY